MCPPEPDANVRLLARVLDEASDLVLITDSTPPSRGGPFVEYANDALLQATGYTMEELAGKPYAALLAQENNPVLVETIMRNLETARVNEKELLLRRADGTSFWAEFAAKPVLDEVTGLHHWVALGKDITLLRQTIEQTAMLMTALDAVSGHVEIYTLHGGEYTAVFRNRDADSDISELVDTLLNEPALRQASGLRMRLLAGENVTITADGLQLRPCGSKAETLLAIKQRAS